MANAVKVRDGSRYELVFRAEEVRGELIQLFEAVRTLYSVGPVAEPGWFDEDSQYATETTQRRAKVISERIGNILGRDLWPF
jgi:hypothetical protein